MPPPARRAASDSEGADGRAVIVCTYEDRDTHAAGLKLLVLSLARHHPALPVHVYSRLRAEHDCWLKAQPNVTLRDGRRLSLRKWNVKPAVLLDALESDDRAVWLDTDVILAGPAPIDRLADAAVLVASQEWRRAPQPGSRVRTEAWNLPFGREIGETVNSCVVAASQAHRPLLTTWCRLMNSDLYRDLQRREQRPTWAHGDQDLLTAVLGSCEYMDVEVDLLQRGRDLVHDFLAQGFTSRERLGCLWNGLPAFIHQQGPQKPWSRVNLSPVVEELSPYLVVALDYVAELGERPPWLDPRRPLSRVIDVVTLGHPVLRGLAPTVAWELKEHLKRLRQPRPAVLVDAAG